MASVKERVLSVVQSLPENASFDDILDAIIVREKIVRGISQTDAGEVIPHEEVKERMKKWLK